jgi:hypothetical protein
MEFLELSAVDFVAVTVPVYYLFSSSLSSVDYELDS